MVSYSILGLYVLVSVATGFFATVFHLPIWLLQGLHLYLYPEGSVGMEQPDIQSGNGLESVQEKEVGRFVDGSNLSEDQVISSLEEVEKNGKENLGSQKVTLHDELDNQETPNINLSSRAVEDIHDEARLEDATIREARKTKCGDDGDGGAKEQESTFAGGQPNHVQQDLNLKGKAGGNVRFKEFSKTAKKKKDKGKDRFEWNEGNSQILRLTLGSLHFQGRQNFKEYDEVVIYSALGIANLLAWEFVQMFVTSKSVTSSQWLGILNNDNLVPSLVGLFAVYKIVRLLPQVGWEKKTSRRSELALSICTGFLGFLLSFAILTLFATTLMDFEFGKAISNVWSSHTENLEKAPEYQAGFLYFSPVVTKFILAMSAGWLSGILMGPAHRNARAFWLGTDQLQWSISVIKWGTVVQFLLHLNVVMPLFTSMLWIKPMAEIFICKTPPSRQSMCHLDKVQFAEWSINHELHTQLNCLQGSGTECMLKSSSIDAAEGAWVKNLDNSGRNEQIFWQDEEKLVVPENFEQDNYISKEHTRGGDIRKSGTICTGNARGHIGRGGKELADTGKDKTISFWGRTLFVSPSADWAEEVGMPEGTFEQFRLWCLLFTGLLQLFLFRVNMQIYLNDAVLVWYESLHRSRVINLEVTKAKLLLNNYFLCRVALQFLAPGILLVLFLGLSRVWGSQLSGPAVIENSFVSPLFIQATTCFMAWWVIFMWAVLTCTILALYRLGFFLAS